MKLTKEAVLSGKVSFTNIKADDIAELGASLGVGYDYEKSKAANIEAIRAHLIGSSDTVTVSATLPELPEVTELTKLTKPESVKPVESWLTRRAGEIAAEMRNQGAADGGYKAEDLGVGALPYMLRRASKGGE